MDSVFNAIQASRRRGARNPTTDYGQIKSLAAIAARHDGLISVNSGRNLIIVAPEREFAVGEVGDQDEIVREYSGDRLVGVQVIKAGKTTTEAPPA